MVACVRTGCTGNVYIFIQRADKVVCWVFSVEWFWLVWLKERDVAVRFDFCFVYLFDVKCMRGLVRVDVLFDLIG